MNDLSGLTLVAFTAEGSDYDNCIDISAAGFLPIEGDTLLTPPGTNDGIGGPLRFFLARIRKGDLPNLIAVLQEKAK